MMQRIAQLASQHFPNSYSTESEGISSFSRGGWAVRPEIKVNQQVEIGFLSMIHTISIVLETEPYCI
jgi:hypothetical protein